MIEDQRTLVVRSGEGRSLPVGDSTVRLLALGSDTAELVELFRLRHRGVEARRGYVPAA